MNISEAHFKEITKGLSCFYDSDKNSAYSPITTTRKYRLCDGRIAASRVLDFEIREFSIIESK